MYLIPIGTDQPRSRIPKVTLAIIIICFVLYPASHLLRGFMGRVPYDFYKKYKSLEAELMVEWLEDQGEQNPLYAYNKLNYRPEKLKKALESFREDMEDKKLSPELDRKYEKWKELRAELLSYRKKTFDYRLGYVPDDIRLHSFITHLFIHGSFWHVFWNMYFFWVVGIGLEEVWGRRMYLGFFLVGGVAAALGHHLFTASPSIPTIGASGAVSAMMGAYLIRFYHARLRFMFFKWEFWLRA
ncbi:MAG: rhomboid family intramembrane serine protease [bacterium]